MSKCINMPRRSGKTTLLIHSSFVTGAPIIVYDQARKDFLVKQAREQGYEITVYTLREWIGNYTLSRSSGVFIDEADIIIEKALSTLLDTNVIAYTVTLPIQEINKKEE